jgi:predicted nucleic acid-binding protein
LPGVYVDTSALGRVLLREADSGAVLGELERFDRRVASALLRVELRRLGLRRGLLTEATELAAAISLVPVDQDVLDRAEVILPAEAATLDAIHLATAVQLAADGFVDAIMTYDQRLSAAAGAHGLDVLSPA